MNIEISEETAKAIEILSQRYYFGLFQQIVKSEDQEYQLRDAIDELAKKIKESKQ